MRDEGVDACCFGWFLFDFLLSFLVGTGVTTGAGVGGVLDVSTGESSVASFPLRFFPCRRQGCNGVERTRTSQGNLETE